VVGAGTPERAPHCSGASSGQPTGGGGGGVGGGGGGKEECYSATAAIGDGGETPSIEGMERSFSPWRKKWEGIGKLLEMVSSAILLLFWYWGGDREAAEVALREMFLGDRSFCFTLLL
jgi:hypothetical protein